MLPKPHLINPRDSSVCQPPSPQRSADIGIFPHYRGAFHAPHIFDETVLSAGRCPGFRSHTDCRRSVYTFLLVRETDGQAAYKSIPGSPRAASFPCQSESRVKRDGLNLDIEAPVGLQNSNDSPYNGNFFEYMKGEYGYVYSINSFEQVGSKVTIPYFQVGGL